MCEWTAASQRNVIDLTMATLEAVGAPATWVLANHDTARVVTRYGRPVTGRPFTPAGLDLDIAAPPIRRCPVDTDVQLGRRRARAAVLLELALPGGAYVYQGDELGLEEVEDLPEELLQDPTWLRSGHTERGRDGCRVPIPWSGREAAVRVRQRRLLRPGCRSRNTGPVSRSRPRTGSGQPPQSLPSCSGRAAPASRARRRHSDLGRGHAPRRVVLHPRPGVPLPGQLRAVALRLARRCRGPGVLRPAPRPNPRTRRCGLAGTHRLISPTR